VCKSVDRQGVSVDKCGVGAAAEKEGVRDPAVDKLSDDLTRAVNAPCIGAGGAVVKVV